MPIQENWSIKILLPVLIASAIFLFAATKIFAATITISNPSITNDEVIIDVSVVELSSSSCPNIKCYLQGMFTQSTSNPRYFGYTQNNSLVWYEYTGSPEPGYIQSTFFYFEPQQGTWSGQLKVKNNPQDSDYKGSGDYFLRVRRYTGNSSSSTETSNDLTVQLAYMLPTPTPSPSPTPTPTPTPSPTPKSTPSPTSSPTPTKSPTSQSTLSPSPSPQILATGISLVLGEEKIGSPSSLAGESANPIATSEARYNEEEATSSWQKFLPKIFLVLAGIAVLGMAISLFLIQKRRRDKNKI